MKNNTSDNHTVILSAIKKLESSLRNEIRKGDKAIRTEMKSGNKAIRREVLRIEVSAEGIEGKQGEMDKKLDKLQNTLDGFVGVVDDLRTENVVGSSQIRDHEMRINKLEKTAVHA